MEISPLSFKLDWICITLQAYYEMLNALSLSKYIHKNHTFAIPEVKMSVTDKVDAS